MTITYNMHTLIISALTYFSSYSYKETTLMFNHWLPRTIFTHNLLRYMYINNERNTHTLFLNPSRHCSRFSINDIVVKYVFGLASCKGFNIGSCFVGNSAYFSTCFEFPNPKKQTPKKQCALNFPTLGNELQKKQCSKL